MLIGVDLRRVKIETLLSALTKAAVAFAGAKSMEVLFAKPDSDVQWLAFRIEPWEQRSAAPIEAALRECGVEYVCARRDSGRMEFSASREKLVVRSDAAEVGVMEGEVPGKVPREQDAVAFGLRAIGWETVPPWGTIRATKTRAKLIYSSKPVAHPKAKAAAGRVPGNAPGDALDAPDFLVNAKERFPLLLHAIVRPKSARRPEVTKVKIMVGRPTDMIDLTGIERVRGRISIVDSKRPEWGIDVVDLGSVREMVHRSDFYVQGPTTRIVARCLQVADSIELRGARDPIVELPELRRAKYATFYVNAETPAERKKAYGDDVPLDGSDPRPIELPRLEEVGKLTIRLAPKRFVVRLPKLERGDLVVDATLLTDPALVAASVFDIGSWKGKLTVLTRDRNRAIESAVRALIARE